MEGCFEIVNIFQETLLSFNVLSVETLRWRFSEKLSEGGLDESKGSYGAFSWSWEVG